jgi:hypothetical protein
LQVGLIKRYNAKDPLEGLLMLLRRDFGLGTQASFTCMAAKSGDR